MPSTIPPPQPDYRYELDHLGQESSVFTASLQYVFDTIIQWYEENGETQPLTAEIITVLHTLAYPPHETANLTSLQSATYDGIGLTLFTGSRVSEYAQSTVRCGSRFATVPCNISTGINGGKPLAFILDDFTFINEHSIVQSWDCHTPPAVCVCIRFRFDKSPRNFSFRTFQRVSRSFLLKLSVPSSSHHIPCPVRITQRLIKRWYALGGIPNTPLLAYQSLTTLKYVTASQITLAIRHACKLAYPNPNHIIRKLLHKFSSHSGRVFACLALHRAGLHSEAIAYRIRWHKDTVRKYIRESSIDIEPYTAAAIAGIYISGYEQS